MAPQITILATEVGPQIDSGFTHDMRILHTDTIDGQVVKSIRYVSVPPWVLPQGWVDPDFDVQLPDFPSGDWNMVDLVRDKTTGNVVASNPRNIDVKQIDAWHPLSIDYFGLEKLTQLPSERPRDRRSDTLWLVRHKSLPGPALMKIAETPPLDLIANETLVYKHIEGKGIGPKFLGHVTESGRIIGFLLEYIEDGRLPRAGEDDEACKAALRKLHEAGWLHNDAHSGNFIVKPDGTATLIDFEFSELTDDESLLGLEMRVRIHGS